MCFSLYFLSFTVGSVSAIISQFDQRNNFIDSILTKIDFFSKECSIPRDLQNQIVLYIKKNTRGSINDMYDKKDLIESFSKNFKIDLINCIHNGAYKEFEFFQHQNENFLLSVIPLMETREYPVSTAVYSAGESATEIYFILNGKIHYKANSLMFKIEHASSCIGAYEVFKKIAREFTVSTGSITTL